MVWYVVLKEFVPKLTEMMKDEVLARVNAFPHSGLTVKMYGNVCRYFNSYLPVTLLENKHRFSK